MTGPIPDPETGTLDSGQTLDQMDVLCQYLKTHSVAFTLQYVPATESWTGLFVDYSAQCKTRIYLGRYPTEVIYRLLKEATE